MKLYRLKSREELARELFTARETNRRLNRRCQYLESQISRLERQHSVIPFHLELDRFRYWTNMLRALYREEYRRVHYSLNSSDTDQHESFFTKIGSVLQSFFK